MSRRTGDEHAGEVVRGGDLQIGEGLLAFELGVEGRLNVLDQPAPGEYGLLPPGAVSSASVASSGKIYTFSVGR